jgi:iron complex outermembrane receptor protein
LAGEDHFAGNHRVLNFHRRSLGRAFMKTVFKTALLAGAAWSAMAGFAAAQSAPAKPAADTGQVTEVVVTARRISESEQRTPVAVSAFTQRQLDSTGVTDVTGLQGAVPNLNIAQGRGSADATNIYIRGVGQPDALQTFDPAVGVYIDDVYYSRIRGTKFDLLDLQDVEVLPAGHALRQEHHRRRPEADHPQAGADPLLLR